MEKDWTTQQVETMPVIALRGLTIFPNVLIHFDVAREISIKALEEAMTAGSPVFLVGQKDLAVEKPEAKDLYTVGTVSKVRQILRMPGDNVRVMVEGLCRGSLDELKRTSPYLEAVVRTIPAEKAGNNSAKTEALIRSTYEMFQQYTELAPKTAPDLLINVLASEDPGYIADFIAQNIAMRNSDKQEARTESDRVLQKVIFSIMADNMELFKQYTDNQDFKKWLSDLVFNLTYNKDGKPYQTQSLT